jgi:DNA-binding transcriptional MerR regulator
MEQNAIAIPEKLYYKAAEVCQITDTQPYVLRFWESEFPQLASEKNRSGQRVYRRQDIDLVFRIKQLLYQEEYTIAGARRAIDEDKETIVAPGPSKSRTRRAAKDEESTESAVHTAPATATSTPAPLFGETRPESPETPVAVVTSPAVEEEARYRALYEEATATLNDLRERNRRLAARLEASLS